MANQRKTLASLLAVGDWVSVSPLSGTGTDTVSVTVGEYTGRNSRATTLTATTTGGETATASISQNGKEEYITVSTVAYSASASGDIIEINGTSNSATLVIQNGTSVIDGVTYSLQVNNVTDDSWDGKSDVGIDGDPGADAEYSFKLSVTIPESVTTSLRSHIFTINNSESTVSSDQITITQSNATVTYGEIDITEFNYSIISASGGTVTPTINYSQTYGYNGATTGGGVITSGATLSYSGSVVDDSSGSVTAASKGTTVSDMTTVDTVTVTVSLNGRTASTVATVSQAANIATYGNISVTEGTVDDIPASGGVVSSITGLSATQIVSYTSGSTSNGSINISYSDAITAASLGTTVTSRSLVGTLTATITGEGDISTTSSVNVYQAANQIEAYSDVSLGLITPVYLSATGQTYDLGEQVDSKFNQTRTYTSGATANCDITLEEYSVVTAVDGFSLNADTAVVTVTENPGTSTRGGFVVEVTITGEGSKFVTEQVTFNQQGSESYIQISPDTLTFEAVGETKSVIITSNDNWTIE